MPKPVLSLQPSEGVVVRSAATIYAAYVTAGWVEDGMEHEWLRRALGEAYTLARLADESYQSDNELG